MATALLVLAIVAGVRTITVTLHAWATRQPVASHPDQLWNLWKRDPR